MIYAFLIGIARGIVKMNHGSVFVQKANPDPIVKTMVMLMEIGEDGENGQHVQQRVVMVREKEQENATVQEPKEKANTAPMMEVDVMKWKIVTLDSIVQLIKLMAIGDIGNIGQPVLLLVVVEIDKDSVPVIVQVQRTAGNHALEKGIKRIITAILLIVR